MTAGPRVAIAGGGTAGHVYPGLALASSLRDRGWDVSFVGADGGVESTLVPQAAFPFHAIPARPFIRSFSLAAVRAPFIALGAIGRARAIVRGAAAVVGMGGYVSVSTVLAARRERIPVVLHEQNAIPGLANRVLARAARSVALSFADTRRFFPRRMDVQVTGNPVREEILRVPDEREQLRKEALQELELMDGRRTVVVFGGSQGALHVDRAAIGACRVLSARSDLQVVLITGPSHLEVVSRAAPAGAPLIVRLFGYIERMDLVYACADLVVARAGATTIAEVTVCGLPSVLIPYPYATRRHQEANARAVQRAGGASVLLDDQLSAEALANRIVGLIEDPERLAAMSERARAFGRPEAAARLADVVEHVARP